MKIDTTHITIEPKFVPNTPSKRKHKSEVLDDIIYACAGVRGYSRDIEKAAIEADKNRREGKAWDSTAAKKKYDALLGYVQGMQKFFE